MRKIFIHILLLLFCSISFAQVGNQTQNKSMLASSFYRNNEFAKAAPLYLELFESSNMPYYFDNYINCLLGMKDYDTAEKVIKKQLRKNNDYNLQITLGYVYKEKGEIAKANSEYDKVINGMPRNMGTVVSIASNFLNRREYEYAEKTYIKGRNLIPGEMFRSNLATIYAYTRNYSRMMEEYLQLLKENENQLPAVEGRLNSLIRYDFDNSLQTLIKKEVLKKTIEDPGTIIYNRLLIWFFVQEQNYSQALVNSIALDKRTKTEEGNIFNFAQSALQNNLFDIALNGLNYLLNRQPVIANIDEVKKEIVIVEYNKYISTPNKERTSPDELVSRFDKIINELGYTAGNSAFIINYAHFLAFYLNRTEKAFDILNNAIKISSLSNLQRSALRMELADLDVYDNNLWEATLLYAQIIDANRENPVGDEAKLKKAKLSFYLGEISWAKDQLDVLKASTSKMIANDAMDLSLLISAYYELDTTDVPIQLFARGDLLLYQNKEKQAVETYDSITTLFPGHLLGDKILMRKAFIKENNFDYEGAADTYKKVLSDYAFSTSADDALYRMAMIKEKKLGQKDKAMELYKQLLLNYPSSIYVSDSRNRFRILRGDKVSDEEFPEENDLDKQFFNAVPHP